MRCPNGCNDGKFVQQELNEEAEVQSEGLDGTSYTAEVRVTFNCVECSEEMREGNFSFDTEIDHECDPKVLDAAEVPGEANDSESRLELDGNTQFEVSEHTQTKDRKGKPIIRSRYQKRIISVSGVVSATCKRCDDKVEQIIEDEMAASEFDSLN